jgi:hypothetical protein
MPKQTPISFGAPRKDPVGYSRAIRTGDHVYGTTSPDRITPKGLEVQSKSTRNTIETALTNTGAIIGSADRHSVLRPLPNNRVRRPTHRHRTLILRPDLHLYERK